MVAALGCRQQDGVEIDGSSTVYPVAIAAAEMFRQEHGRAQISIAQSGTGGGFKKFLVPEPELRTDINNASRPIKPTEQATAAELGIEYLELPVAYDGIAVVVHPSNDFVDYLTVAELNRIYGPGSEIDNWQQVREGFPDLPLKAYGPSPNHGTFEYFTEMINGEARATRQDYAASETKQIVQGVAGDRGAIGYFGFAYYLRSEDDLKLVAVKNGAAEPVKPSPETISNLSYQPLARPIFMYVNQHSAETKPTVDAYVYFLIDNAERIVAHERVGYVPLSPALYETIRQRYRERVTGTLYPDTASHHKSLYQHFGLARGGS
jgi:phosphate transport system substrate-binding protein